MKSNMWLHWGHVAAENEVQARSARSELVERWGQPGTGGLMRPEMEASLATVTAAACCIDAIHFEVANAISRDWDTRGKGMPAWKYWMQTFAEAFGRDVQAWRHDMQWLAELRNDSVHPKPRTRTPMPHPGVQTNTQYEFTVYTHEAAERAVSLVERVYEVVFRSTNPNAVAELRSIRSR